MKSRPYKGARHWHVYREPRGAVPSQPTTLQVLLDEARTEVHVELHQRRITNRLEAVDLTGLDDKDISGAALEGLAVDGPLHLRVCKYKP